jgi:hypothetical protein
LKSKNKIRLIIGCAVLFFLSLFIRNLADSDAGPDYTVFSAGQRGASLLFDTLRQLRYPVYAGYTPIDENAGINDVYILIEPDETFFRAEVYDALNWVRRGGCMIFLEDRFRLPEGYLRDAKAAASYEDFTVYQLGLGEIVIAGSERILNERLMNDSAAGQIVAGFLNSWGGNRIYFGEYIHGYRNARDQWPASLRIFALQIALAAAALIWFLGKRLGRPIPYYEEIERDENEYCKALANLYRVAGQGNAALDGYYQDFVRKCARAFHVDARYAEENLTALWRENKLPHPERLAEIQNAAQAERFNTRRSFQKKQLLRRLRDIQEMETIVRRSSLWR